MNKLTPKGKEINLFKCCNTFDKDIEYYNGMFFKYNFEINLLLLLKDQ